MDGELGIKNGCDREHPDPANEDTVTDEQVQNDGSRELIPGMYTRKSVAETASEMSIPVEEPGLAPKTRKVENQNIAIMKSDGCRQSEESSVKSNLSTQVNSYSRHKPIDQTSSCSKSAIIDQVSNSTDQAPNISMCIFDKPADQASIPAA
ncbi:hypothetical protein ACOSQ3_004058 [Xanthoceras sorbifolium]